MHFLAIFPSIMSAFIRMLTRLQPLLTPWPQTVLFPRILQDVLYSICFEVLPFAGAMELGDVSWHNGWTLHTAAEQPQGSPSRLALSISFFKDGTRLLAKEAAQQVQTEDQESFQEWRKEVRAGATARHKLLPLLGAGSARPEFGDQFSKLKRASGR